MGLRHSERQPPDHVFARGFRTRPFDSNSNAESAAVEFCGANWGGAGRHCVDTESCQEGRGSTRHNTASGAGGTPVLTGVLTTSAAWTSAAGVERKCRMPGFASGDHDSSRHPRACDPGTDGATATTVLQEVESAVSSAACGQG